MLGEYIHQQEMVERPAKQGFTLGLRVLGSITRFPDRPQGMIGRGNGIIVAGPDIRRGVLPGLRSRLPVIHLLVPAVRPGHDPLANVITHHLAHVVIMTIGVSRYQQFLHRLGGIQYRTIVGYYIQERVTGRGKQQHHSSGYYLICFHTFCV